MEQGVFSVREANGCTKSLAKRNNIKTGEHMRGEKEKVERKGSELLCDRITTFLG